MIVSLIASTNHKNENPSCLLQAGHQLKKK